MQQLIFCISEQYSEMQNMMVRGRAGVNSAKSILLAGMWDVVSVALLGRDRWIKARPNSDREKR
jgi:hypothetical protein